jgi:sorting nexin-41/42
VNNTYRGNSVQLQDLEQNWQEPLHEYSQFASIIKKLLAYRHQKHVQLEMTQDALEARRESLGELEKSEREARRLDEALDRGRSRSIPATEANNPTSPDAANEDDASVGAEEDGGGGGRGNEQHDNSASVVLPPHPGPSPVKRRAPGMGLLSALSYTIHGMMDADPESARRSGISKTRETISQVATLMLRTTVDG